MLIEEGREEDSETEKLNHTVSEDQSGLSSKFNQTPNSPAASTTPIEENAFSKFRVPQTEHSLSRLKLRPSVNSLPSIAHLQRYFTSPGESAVQSKYVYPLPEQTPLKDKLFTIQELGIPVSPLKHEPKIEIRQKPDLDLLRPGLENSLSHVLQQWEEKSDVQILPQLTNDALATAATYLSWQTDKEDEHHLQRIRELRIDVLYVLQSRQHPSRYQKILTQTETIRAWVEEIKILLHRQDLRKKKKHESYAFLIESTQNPNDLKRYCIFLDMFDPSPIKLPDPTTPDFLILFRPGVKLCNIFNNFVSQSSRQYGHIDRYHTDTKRPYRAIENLQFFAKAIEIRFERRLPGWDAKEIVRATDRGNGILLDGMKVFCEAAINTLTAESKKLHSEETLHR